MMVAGVIVVFAGHAASGATRGKGDVQIARAAAFVAADFPAGFRQEAATASSNADNIKAAKGIAGCAPYVAVQKLTAALPQARSADFTDDSRTISNEVDVFRSNHAAGDALSLYAKSSTVGCLEQLLEKRLRVAADPADHLDDVVVTLQRQDIAGLGDDSVVYEGNVELTASDQSTAKIGVGVAAVQVGRAVDAVTYRTTGEDLTEILTPAIDASAARLRTALGLPAV